MINFWNGEDIQMSYVSSSKESPAKCIAISPNGAYISVGCQDRSIRIYSIDQIHPIHVWTQHSREIKALAYSPCEKYLFSSSKGGTLFKWTLLIRDPIFITESEVLYDDPK